MLFPNDILKWLLSAPRQVEPNEAREVPAVHVRPSMPPTLPERWLGDGEIGWGQNSEGPEDDIVDILGFIWIVFL